MRSSSRRTPGFVRTSPTAWSASSALFSDDAASMGREAVRALGASLRGEGRRDDQHWLERLMSDEQRRLFRETQAVMSLLEGFSDHVMDDVGKDLVPGVERISARFHGRREQRTPFERAMLRITGMDLKMDAVPQGRGGSWPRSSELGGAAALRRLWDGPETLPTPRGDRRLRTRGSGGWDSTRTKEGPRDDGRLANTRTRLAVPAACRWPSP